MPTDKESLAAHVHGRVDHYFPESTYDAEHGAIIAEIWTMVEEQRQN